MEATLVFPHQLFYPNPSLSKRRKTFLIEDPLFFSDSRYPAVFHKQKILLHLLSMRSFREKLNAFGYDTSIVDKNSLPSPKYYDSFLKDNSISSVHYLELHDFILSKRLISSINRLSINKYIYDSPGFINGKDEINKYFTNKKKYFFTSFYQEQRKKLNILLDKDSKPLGGKWTFDKENRKKLPKKIQVPKVHNNNYENNSLESTKNEVYNNYPDNYGKLELFNYPINHDQAKQSFKNFLQYRFSNFGTYEDAISTDHRFIFHSIISPSLNIGLITPREIIGMTLDFIEESNIPLNSTEGFLRQIIGWREFTRGIYESNGSFQRKRNFWNFEKKIPPSFYDGSTGIKPVDDTIKNIINYAYCHHIERLMVIGNIMCLLRYDPDEVYRWFMELFIDAYDWVMVPNIYGMSLHSDGGLMTTKPYISGSNYILKMSNYKKDNWCGIWDALYWDFIDKERDFFKKNPRMSMMVNLYDKKNTDIKKKYQYILNNLQV